MISSGIPHLSMIIGRRLGIQIIKHASSICSYQNIVLQVIKTHSSLIQGFSS